MQMALLERQHRETERRLWAAQEEAEHQRKLAEALRKEVTIQERNYQSANAMWLHAQVRANAFDNTSIKAPCMQCNELQDSI